MTNHYTSTKRTKRNGYWKDTEVGTMCKENPKVIFAKGILRARPLEKMTDYTPLTRKAIIKLKNKISTLVEKTPGIWDNFILNIELPHSEGGINQKHYFFVEISGYFHQSGQVYCVKDFMAKFAPFLDKFFETGYEVFNGLFEIKQKS